MPESRARAVVGARVFCVRASKKLRVIHAQQIVVSITVALVCAARMGRVQQEQGTNPLVRIQARLPVEYFQ